jgi:hypothetical protein
MATTCDALLDLVGLAYEAALGPRLWPQVAASPSAALSRLLT